MVSPGAGGTTVGNLFRLLGQPGYVLPAEVNEPTRERLTDIVTKHLGLSADIIEPLTVKQIVDEMCRFTSSNTLCWQIFAQMSSSSGDDKNTLRRDMQQVSALGQVFARCAKPVLDTVAEVLLAAPSVQESTA